MTEFVRALGAGIALASLLLLGRAAQADDVPYSDTSVLGAKASSSGLRIQSAMTRITAYEQDGHGYQSKDGPLPLGPGSERLTVLEPQLEIVARQGDKLTYRLWLPVDMVTSASANAIDKGADVVSTASLKNVAGSVDATATYQVDRATKVSVHDAIHLESPFRSWTSGLSLTHSFAGDAAVFSAGLMSVYDWFDRFDINGGRHGRTNRSSTTLSLGLSQVLTPTTVVAIGYGGTVQAGELGNTWNSVPLTTFTRGPELLPSERVRQSLVVRGVQALPWNGALRLYYRLYDDDWGMLAHAIEGQLAQRISPQLYLAALYRFHTQAGASFFTTLANPAATLRTADSDLAPLDSHTVGGKVVGDVPLRGLGARAFHFEVAYERYFRTNDLWANIVTCATGLLF
ncbi:MAG TPA: DUF3570 domain-containing protein [Polyangiaceae bacterium]